MHRRSHVILAILIALASVMPAMSSMRGFVLCISSDGRMAIETQHLASGCAVVCSDSLITDGEPYKVRLPGGQVSNPHSCSDVSFGRFDFRSDRFRPTLDFTGFDTASAPFNVLARSEVSTAEHSGSNLTCTIARRSERTALRSVILHL
jgi:hypothetical protein